MSLSGFALVLSVAIAALVMAYTGRLQRRIRDQQIKDAGQAREFERMAARLSRAQEDERRLIARELHDEVGQSLTALKLELSHAAREATLEEMVSALESARAIVDRTLHTVRDLSSLLHPQVLDELGLVAALEALVRDFSRRTDVATDFSHERVEQRMGTPLEVCAYRIVQEALTNVARHSGATHCRVQPARIAATIRIIIEDNGKGFQPNQVAREHSGGGLSGLRERAAGCGGTWTLDSDPGRGTRIVVELPVDHPPAGERNRARAEDVEHR